MVMTRAQMLAQALQNNTSYNMGNSMLQQGMGQAYSPGQAIGNALTTYAGFMGRNKGQEQAEQKADSQSQQLAKLLTSSGFNVPQGVDPGMAMPIIQAKSNMDLAKSNQDIRRDQIDWTRQNADRNFNFAKENADRSYGLDAAKLNAPKAEPLVEVYDPESQATVYRPRSEAIGMQSKAPKVEDKPDTIKIGTDLRKEYNNLAKPLHEMNQSYSRMLNAASDQSAAGDIALIFAYMKMLDPTSVVREGEFATAQNSAGVPDSIMNMYNKALDGTRLQPEQRLQFLNQAKSQYQGASGLMDTIDARYSDLANEYGVSPEQIIMTRPDFTDQFTSVEASLGGSPAMAKGQPKTADMLSRAGWGIEEIQ
ncbi:hypothetical protein [Terasakiella pusilla]|uniref:hypothetical protein n=1 Tax=Terasakiella pusilla TaxID=64973 RepID=UPI003AA99482